MATGYDETSERSRRQRELSEKGQAQYEENVSRKNMILFNQRKNIVSLMQELSSEEANTELFEAIREQLAHKCAKYNSDFSVFESYLNRLNTLESKNELCSLRMIDRAFKEQVSSIIDSDLASVLNIGISQEEKPAEVEKPADVRSETSTFKEPSVASKQSSSRSSKRSVIMLAEAEALKAKLQFAEQEHLLKLEQAALNEEEAIIKAKSTKKSSH